MNPIENDERNNRIDEAYRAAAEARHRPFHEQMIRVPLPEGWGYLPSEQYDVDGELQSWVAFHLRDANGPSFDILMRDGRLKIRGNWPSYLDQNQQKRQIGPWDLWGPKEETLGITLAPTKTPEQIGRDITRRFLPEYLRIWQRCKEKADMWTAHHANKNATAERLGLYADVPVRDMHRDAPEFCIETGTRPDQAYHWFTINSPTSIEAKLRLDSPEKAEKLIDWIRGNL